VSARLSLIAAPLYVLARRVWLERWMEAQLSAAGCKV
jgi:hypothetical protein